MNLFKWFFWFLLIAFLLPFSSGSVLPNDCFHLSGWQRSECQNILSDHSLSVAQKEELYLNLVEEQGQLGSFDFVWGWNNAIEWIGPPSGVVPKSSGIIENAWLKIVSVHKSFFDLNEQQWFVEPSGKVLSAYGFSIELPTGTEAGDCRTDYSYQLLSEDLQIKLNGSLVGSSQVSNYTVSVTDGQAMNFQASLVVKARLRVDHFREREYCSFSAGASSNGECFSLCEFAGTEFRHYSVSLSDEFSAKALIQEISVKTFLERNSGLSKLRVVIDSEKEVNDFELSFGSSLFGLSESNFDLGTTLEPYQALYVMKSKELGKSLQGFLQLDFNEAGGRREIVLGSTGSGACFLKIFSDFEALEKECNLIELKPTQLEIELGKDSFDVGEEIAVRVGLSGDLGTALSNKKVLLQYGSNFVELVTGADGAANASVNASESNGFLLAKFESDAEFKGSQAVKRFSLMNSENLGSAGSALGFFGSYYLVFFALKKKFGVF